MSKAQLDQATKLVQAGNPAQAEGICREAVKASPGDMRALRLLGQITRLTGKAPESVRIFQEMRKARPGDIQLVGELGASLTAANQHAHAIQYLDQAVRAMPTATIWKIWMGKCLLKLFNTDGAVKVLKEAHESDPDHPELKFHYANALLTAARPAHAEPIIREFLEKNPHSVPGRVTLANILEHENRLDEAAEVCYGLLKKDPNFGAALGTLARCLRAQGKYAEAVEMIEPLTRENPTADQALALGPIYLAEKRFEDCKTLFENVLKTQNLPDPVRASLTFGLGQSYNGLKQYDESFRCFKRANELFPRNFVREQRLRLYQDMRTAFSKNNLAGPRAEVDASKCVFVVGMPRSGTSLVEQILDSHPRIHGAGELVELPFTLAELAQKMNGKPPSCLADLTQEFLDFGGQRYIDAVTRLAPDADIIVDKLPHNFELLGLIYRLFPGARVIHCMRNPIDNCVSCYFTQLSTWHSYSTDLSNLGWTYGQYLKLMNYWRENLDLNMIDVQYEETVADLEGQARRIIDFVGQEWDDRCLKFYETERAVTTASVDQVRQPIYTSSVSRWKRYGDHVTPLIESLKAAGVPLADA